MYCNCVFGSLSEANLRKLQKMQNNAVRFIYGFSGMDNRKPITPYLKELHFLPVRFRIKYKIALMVFKCLNDLAPKYLIDLLDIRECKRQSLRLDNDFFVLKLPPTPNYVRTEGAFCHSGPRIWNDLPYTLRCISDVTSFKKDLKTHYFNLAFDNFKC